MRCLRVFYVGARLLSRSFAGLLAVSRNIDSGRIKKAKPGRTANAKQRVHPECKLFISITLSLWPIQVPIKFEHGQMENFEARA